MAIYGNNDLNWTRVTGTAAGTQIIKPAGNGHFGGVYVGIPSSGTITYWDSSTGTPGSSGTQMFQVANNGTKIPDSFSFNCRVNNGIVAVLSAGTVDQTVFWD